MNALSSLLTSVVSSVIKGISPEIREFLKDAVDELKVKASKTPNPYDDLMVELLSTLLGM